MAAPVRIHPRNPHYLLFRDKPTFLVTSAEHYGAVLNADFDWRKYLAALAGAGLNYTRIFTGSYVEIPGSFGIKRNTLAPAPGRFLPPWARSDEPGYRGGGNKFDLERWSPEYFERLRGFVAEASRLGIVVEVTFFSSHYRNEHWLHSPFHPANNVNGTTELDDYTLINTMRNGNIAGRQEAMVRKIVGELNAYDNVIYEFQNEPWADRTVPVLPMNPYLEQKWPNSADLGDEASLEWQKQVAFWIADAEVGRENRHLLVQNICNFRYPVPLDQLVGDTAIVNFHYAYPEAVLWNYNIGRLISYDESGFLGTGDEVYRMQGWNFLLAGGGIFNNLDYSFSVGHEDGSDTDPNGPGGGSPAFRNQLRVLREFLESLPFLEMKPDSTTVLRSPGVVPRAFSAAGKAYALYLTGQSPADITLDLPKGSYKAEWIDTKNGRAAKATSFDHPGGTAALVSPPFSVDIALKVVAS
jgi:hypothetical protein